MSDLTIWCPVSAVPTFKRVVSDVVLPCEVSMLAVDPKRPPPPLPGGVLLLLGNALAEHVRQAKLTKKNATLTSMREQVFTVGEEEDATRILVSYDPTITEREAERLTDFLWDLRLAARLAATGSLAPVVGQYEWVDDFDALEAEVAGGDVPRLALDLETLGLDPWAPHARILTLALTPEAGRSYVYRVPHTGKPPKAVLKALERLLCGSLRVMGANLKYDLVWLAKHWNLRGVNQSFDTHLVGSLLDENRSNSLEVHAKVYTDMGGYDTEFNRRHDKDRMDLALEADPDGFLTYAGGDTDACFRVAAVQRRALTQDKRLRRFYQRVLQPAARVFAKVEERGVLVDRGRYKELEVECAAEMDKLTKEAFSHVPRRILLKYADNLSLTRPAIIQEFLFTRRGLDLTPEIFTTKGNEPSTAAEHLNLFADNPKAGPFIRAVQKYAAVAKTMGTYIVGFQKHIRSDGRFHPTYRLGRGSSREDLEGGTVTGRLSATDPAYQTIPKRTVWAKPLRTVYPCPEGMGIAKFDFNQGELRIMGCLANDPTMIAAYASNSDLHTLTAATTMGLTVEQFAEQSEWVRDEKRRAAKAINFGLLYGMGAEGLVDYSRKSYGVDMTVSQASHYRDAFFDLYDRLPKFHEQQKRLVRKQGYVRNPLGRIRHLPLISSPEQDVRALCERQAINSPIQSCLSDMMLLAMVQLDALWPHLWIFGMTHDSVEVYLPLDGIEQQAREIKQVLENLPLEQFGWSPPIRFVADAEIATEGTLADVKKVSL